MGTRLEFTMRKPLELDVAKVRIDVAVRYGEEDMPQDFFGRHGDLWSVSIDLRTGVIDKWPNGTSAKLHMKVCDEGSYYLDQRDETLCAMEQEYVPSGFPGDHYGDYIIFNINGHGAVEGWSADRVVESFQRFADER